MKIEFPPDDLSECGSAVNSLPYQPFVREVPVVTYLVILWCVVAHYLGYTADGIEAFVAKQESLGALRYIAPNIDPFWKLFASCMLHDPQNLIHIIFNMSLFLTFGSLVERGIGSFYTAILIVLTGVVSSSFGLSIEGPGIGMSGVVYALAGFMWSAWPRWTGFLEKFRGSTVKFLIFWQVICFVLTFSGTYPIGNASHISGMLIGYLIGKWACYGHSRGRWWMVATLLMVGISVLIWFWSPWNEAWRYLNENPDVADELREMSR